MRVWKLLTASYSIDEANQLAGVYDPKVSTRTQVVGDGADADLGLQQVPDVWEYMDTYVPDLDFGPFEIMYVLPNILTPNGTYDLVVVHFVETCQVLYCWAEYEGIAKPVKEDMWVIPETYEKVPRRPRGR